MIKAIIIDDEPLARSVLKEFISEYSEIDVVQESADGFDGLKAINTHHPDLLFLDVQMPKINGFEMLELLEDPPPVIFTTAYDEFAIKAFDLNAVDYLLKPFSKQRFDKAIQRYLKLPRQNPLPDHTSLLLQSHGIYPSQNERVVVKNGGKIKIIPVPEIFYMEGADDYVKIFTKEGSFLKNKTLAFFEKTLISQQFIRVHRSYLINISQITRIDPYEKEGHLAILKSGGRIPVSKNGFINLKEALGL